MKNKSKGFTLIELLVVIAIIALLLSIIMPALRKVKSVALRVTCSNHLHQCGLSLAAYGTAYDNKLPTGGGYSLRHILLNSYKLLESTTDDTRIFVCPAFTYFREIVVTGTNEEFDGTYHMEPYPSMYNFGKGDHGYYIGYFYLGGRDLSDWDWTMIHPADRALPWKSPATFSDGSHLVVMADVIETAFGSPSWTEAVHKRGGWERVTWPGQTEITPKDIKAEGVNKLTLDGSVSWYGLEDLNKYPRSKPGYYRSYGYW
jgi:prepilin-type N-terminal cleavage/methylation domain-containing protein